MMRKKNKSRLEMKNGVQARTLDDIRNNFEPNKIAEYFSNGMLHLWLEERYYEYEADQINALSKDDANRISKLRDILGVSSKENTALTDLSVKKESNGTNDTSGLSESVRHIIKKNGEITSKPNTTMVVNPEPKVVAAISAAIQTMLGSDISNLKVRQTVSKKNNDSIQSASLIDNIYYLKNEAAAGNAEAMFRVGRMYHTGNGEDKNISNAMGWYKKAAKAGNADAMFEIGAMFDKGDGVAVDKQKALKWYNKAIDAGNTDAMVNIGLLYENGEVFAKNTQKAMEWYQRAVDEGNINAMNRIGDMYYCGIGVEQDQQQALKWFQNAAEAGNAHAMFIIGTMYHSGSGVTKSMKNAILWYKKAAIAGNVDAMHNIGWMYSSGEGVPENKQEAIKWYKKAAEKGDYKSMHNIGFLYSSGIGIEKNEKKAMEWLQKAILAGDTSALIMVGDAYENGKGVEKDYDKAKYYYMMAKDAGISLAQERLEQLEKKTSKFCFITTAVCNTFGKPDNCYELTMFRNFRDNWLLHKENGSKLVEEYYNIAPLIVEQINNKADATTIYSNIWSIYLKPCLTMIEEGKNLQCEKMYIKMVYDLQRKYLS